MIIDSTMRTTWYVGPMGNIETARLKPYEAPVFDRRVMERLVYGAVYDAMEAGVADVVFYPPELEPDVVSYDSWALLGVTVEDVAHRSSWWVGSGDVNVAIKTRSSAANIYQGRAVADSLTALFAGMAIAISGGGYTGYALFGEPSTWARGGLDGCLVQEWAIPFAVMPNR